MLKTAAIFFGLIELITCSYLFWNNLKLEPSLLKFIILSNQTLRQKCASDKYCSIEIKDEVQEKCWGFEPNCQLNQSYSSDLIKCLGKSSWPGVVDKTTHKELFWKQADFALLKQTFESIEPICESNSQDDSFLECSDHLRFCHGRNIFFNFKNLRAKSSKRYRDDVILKGQVGGKCDNLNADLLSKRANELSFLQSWGNELKYFESFDDFQIDDQNCDVIFEKPTIIIKLDAAVNMFHHFCDFINLYATQFIGQSFSKDIDILWWETHSDGYKDEDFGVTWKAFSSNDPIELVSLDGKKVCFKDVTFSLLARQRLGLYYNMPLVDGCSGSGLFQAFNRHVLHRLGIEQTGPLFERFRVTFLERKTHYRKALNMNELTKALQKLPNVELNVVSYESGIPFEEQLKITQNTDILIGMHGSGLTHLLFLPDWAVLFELYNCGDVDCYKDLSRLRGINYFTWTNPKLVRPDKPGVHPSSGEPHEKFANYIFDADEFVKLVNKSIEFVRRHPEFIKHQRRLRRLQKSDL